MMLFVIILISVIALTYLVISVKVSGGIPVSLSDAYYKRGNRKLSTVEELVGYDFRSGYPKKLEFGK